MTVWDDVDTLWRVSSCGCCEVCAAHDGRVLTFVELERQVMPLGEPVYGCLNPERCDCAAMPAGTAA